MQEQKGEFLTKEEYNKIPVYYCKHCGSLAIMTMPENPDDYCDKCGSTDIGIEHNLDVIKMADYIIDLGPEGGDAGGNVVCAGTPEEVAACAESYTGRFLKSKLKAKK